MNWATFSLRHPEAAADWLAYWRGPYWQGHNPDDKSTPVCTFVAWGNDMYKAIETHPGNRSWRRLQGAVEWTEVP